MTTSETMDSLVHQLRETIRSAQLRAASSVNREMLQLYYLVGHRLHLETKKASWGDKVLSVISDRLREELPGLRGFSAQNMKKMRLFYEVYAVEESSTLKVSDLTIGSALLNQLSNESGSKSSALLNQFPRQFWSIGFTSHIYIATKARTQEERQFYILKCAEEGWSSRTLLHHLKNELYHREGRMPSNFESTIPEVAALTMAQFRDVYMLDFISLQESDDERLVERRIVENIKDFVLRLGKGFTFMGNQYRLEVEEKEYFIDLLFYNRHLQAMVAFELKRGEFRPQYAGQLNFYLSVLDDKVRLEHEHPSVGIILCKERHDVVVEYALRGMTQPMGVATYRTAEEIPAPYRGILPGAQELIDILKDEEE